MNALRRLLIAIFFICSIGADAQITLQSTFPANGYAPQFEWVYLKHSGYKYLLRHSDTLDVFNLNYSLYKRIFIPAGYLAGSSNVSYVSEGLFDSDSLRIDYMITAPTGDSMAIYQDNGTRVFVFDSVLYNVGYPALGLWYTTPIVTTDSGTFLILSKNPLTSFQVYKLPGSLPCMPSCTSSVTITSTEPSPGSNNGYSNVYPNPAVSYTNIFYTLPPETNEGEVILYDLTGREIKRFNVTSQFDHLRITTSDIKAGTYFYQLIAGSKNISTKKIVVVK